MTDGTDGAEDADGAGASEPDAGGWQVLSEQTVYRNRLHVASRVYRMPDGTESDFEVLLAPEVVLVLCRTEDGRVVLARQFRAGPGRWLGELPGGAVDPGEHHAHAAARELLEETGYAGDMRYVGMTWQSANSTMRIHVYTCTNARQVADQQLDECEFIQPVLVTLDQFRDHLRSGRLTDVAAGYMALDALGLL